MADALTEIDIDEFEAAIIADIHAKFPVFQTIEFDREETERGEFTLPALFLEWDEGETAGAPDPGTEQLAMNFRFAARVVLSFREEKAKRETRKLAFALAAFLRLRRWTGQPTAPAEVIGISPDEWSPKLDQFEVQRVEWAQILHLGESVFKGAGTRPVRVFARTANPEGAQLGEPELIYEPEEPPL